MATIEARIKFRVENDNQAKRAYQNLTDEQKKLIRAYDDGIATYKQTRSALLDLVKTYDDVGRGAREATQAVKLLQDKEQERFQKSLQSRNKSLTAQDRFDQTSRDVALAGDVQSNLGALSGLAGAAGAGGLSQGIVVSGEIFALVEELPRLKDAVGGLPSVLSSAASALGPAGLLVAGVAAGAAAIVALYKNSIKEQEQALQSFAAASADFVSFAAGGGTTEQARQRLEEEKRLVEFANAEILRLEAKYQEQRFLELDTLINSGEQALVDQIKDFQEQIRESESTQQRLQEAINQNELSANDAAAAQENLTDQTTSAVEAFERATSKYRDNDKAVNEATKTLDDFTRATRSFGNEATRTRKALGGSGAIGVLPRNPFAVGGGQTGGESLADRNDLLEIVNDVRRAANEAGKSLKESIISIRDGISDGIEDLEINRTRDVEDAVRNLNILALRDIDRDTVRAANDINRRGLREAERAYENHARNIVNTFDGALLTMNNRTQTWSNQTTRSFIQALDRMESRMLRFERIANNLPVSGN